MSRSIQSIVKQVTMLLAYLGAHDLKTVRRGRDNKLKELQDELSELSKTLIGIADGADLVQTIISQCIDEVNRRGKADCVAIAKRIAAEKLSELSVPPCKQYCNGDLLEESVKSVSCGPTFRIELRTTTQSIVGSTSPPLYFVFEIGVSWHPLYDVPFIPSTSLKGALRHFLLAKCLVDSRSKKACAKLVYKLLGHATELPQDEVFILDKLLGNEKRRELLKELREEAPQGRTGCITFTDLLLAGCQGKDGSCKPFTPAVITPHYSSTGLIRSEYDAEPIPVVHVVLRPGLIFRGCIYQVCTAACSKTEELIRELAQHLDAPSEPLEFFKQVLRAVLSRGIGARTSRGYTRLALSSITQV